MNEFALAALVIGIIIGHAVTWGIWAAVESHRAVTGQTFSIMGQRFRIVEAEHEDLQPNKPWPRHGPGPSMEILLQKLEETGISFYYRTGASLEQWKTLERFQATFFFRWLQDNYLRKVGLTVELLNGTLVDAYDAFESAQAAGKDDGGPNAHKAMALYALIEKLQGGNG